MPDSVVVIDEAYIDFGGESAVSLVARYPQLLVTRTLSKSHALAGLRVGYAIGQPHLIEALNRVKDSFNSYPLDRFAQAGALASMEDHAYFEALCARVVATRTRLVAAMERHGVRGVAVGRQFHLRPSPCARWRRTGRGTARTQHHRAPFQQTRPHCAVFAHHHRHRCAMRCADCRIENPGRLLEFFYRLNPRRHAHRPVTRNTLETQITVSLNLDGTGVAKLATGVPFLDHMLDQIARHGLIDLDIQAKGDLHIDAHHTVEDAGITFGQAFAQALGDKKGIRRYGHAYVPLDEALSRVVIDLSGRPGIEYHVDYTRARIGDFDVDLFLEFFRGFINHAGVTLHIDNLRGINAHHQAETIFKAFGRALRMAVELDARMGDVMPSTKGSL